MALAVASTSTVSANNSDNLTITKPSGVALGDLLVIIAVGEHDGNDGLGNSTIACSGFTEMAQAAREANNSNTDLNIQASMLYRIADASDVSASNYTITDTVGTDALGIAIMLRITGWTTGNPVYSKRETNTSYTESGFSITRPFPQLLLMVNAIKQDFEEYDFSSPSITSSDSNPVWTEVYDTWVTVNAATDQRAISAAFYYANSSNTSTITAYNATASAIAGGGATGSPSGIGILAVLVEPTNVTADISHLAVTPTIEGVTASQVTVTADVSHLPVIPTVNGIETINSSDRTQWTNETKPTAPTWINKDK